jgi:hypothetical protein
MTRHYLNIWTGTDSGAGTDETVKLYFSVEGIHLGSLSIPGDGGRFENGSVDHFVFEASPPLKHADQVAVRITNKGTPAPDWNCDAIRLSVEGNWIFFGVHDWIRPGESYKHYPASKANEVELEFEPSEELDKLDETTGLPKQANKD